MVERSTFRVLHEQDFAPKRLHLEDVAAKKRHATQSVNERPETPPPKTGGGPTLSTPEGLPEHDPLPARFATVIFKLLNAYFMYRVRAEQTARELIGSSWQYDSPPRARRDLAEQWARDHREEAEEIVEDAVELAIDLCQALKLTAAEEMGNAVMERISPRSKHHPAR